MTSELKEFIEKNIHFIEENNFFALFETASVQLPEVHDIGELSSILESIQLNPLSYDDCIYNYYFGGRLDISRYTTPRNIVEVRVGAFQYCKNLRKLILYKNVNYVRDAICLGCELEYLEIQNPYIRFTRRSFNACRIKHIKFNGTKEQFIDTGFHGNMLKGCHIEYLNGSETISI